MSGTCIPETQQCIGTFGIEKNTGSYYHPDLPSHNVSIAKCGQAFACPSWGSTCAFPLWEDERAGNVWCDFGTATTWGPPSLILPGRFPNIDAKGKTLDVQYEKDTGKTYEYKAWGKVIVTNGAGGVDVLEERPA